VAERPPSAPKPRNLVVVVLDSLRYDSWVAAPPASLAELGEVERRWSYASWTAPSHYNLLMGLLPHSSPSEVYASEYYKQDFRRYGERLGVEGMEFRKVLPSIFLPTFLRNTLGYRTEARVSMPVLNPHTAINRDFDHFELMPSHNDTMRFLAAHCLACMTFKTYLHSSPDCKATRIRQPSRSRLLSGQPSVRRRNRR